MLLKNSKPELYKWYEKIYTTNTYTSVLGDYTSLINNGGGKGVSTFLPSTMKILLGKIPLNYYILCPLYSFKDFQLGVTGTAYFNENIRTTVHRELLEELGIFPINYIPQIININNNITTYGSNININKIRCNNRFNIIKGNDNRSTKIAVVIYGKEEDILNKYLTKNIIQYESNDNIIGVLSIPMTAVYKYINS